MDVVLGPVVVAARFLLELCALAALAYWGFRTGASAFARVGLAVLAPLAAAAVWGLFVAPKAPQRLADPLRLAVELAVFAVAVAALAAAGRPLLAAALGVLVATDVALLFRLDLRETV